MRNKKVVIGLSIVLAAILCVLLYIEHVDPEVGSDFVQGLFS